MRCIGVSFSALQTILAMMIKNLPPDEVWTVLGYMRHAVKDTYFEKWLAAGGFRWPTNKVPNTLAFIVLE